ncbi:hypothetical protein AB1Y20_022002 [Prymnesium parvum]|uniref:Uncharacterized protein n=1 Tax=Prymnesium parvum TaxID=97485 RepID=A0AB34JHH1_PRYPA
MTPPAGAPSLMSAAALETKRVESQQHLAHLQEAGVIGMRRPLTIRARLAPPDGVLRPNEKLVHFQRHAQGFHNLMGDLFREFGKVFDSTGVDTTGSPYILPELLDPPLTAIGRQQCQAAQQTAKQKRAQVVLCSPMYRCLQTALLTFDHLLDAVPFVAVEETREMFGAHTSDARRPLSEIEREFGHRVDFSEIRSERDVLSFHEDGTLRPRERVQEEVERIYRFLVYLRSRPEAEIAVVSHSTYLFTMLNAVIEVDHPDAALWFDTCEIRSMVLTFEGTDE